MNSTNKVLNFELTNKDLKIKELIKNDFLELKVRAISDANPNMNKSHFTIESMKEAIPSFINRPILGSFSAGKNDFRGHNDNGLKYDDEMEELYFDYNSNDSERILGMIRESDPIEIKYDAKTKQTWLSFTAALWTNYSYKAVKSLLKNRNGNSSVSVEVEVLDSYEEDGIEHITKFRFLGCTILGADVTPGITGANLTVRDFEANENYSKKKQCLNFAYQALDEYNHKQSESLDPSDQGSNIEENSIVDNEEPAESISMEKNLKKGGEDNPMKKENEAKLNNEQEFAAEEICPDCAENISCDCEAKEEEPCECEAKAECEKEDLEANEEEIEKCEKDPEDDKDEDPDDDKDDDDDEDDDKEEDMSCNKFAADESIVQLATDVMASYQNANKWLDIIKEMLFTDLGCVFFSSYVHTLAHTMPGRFDKFGDILHTVNIKIPYPATEYIPNEVTNVGEAFNSIFMILDSIKYNLNAFIKATDENYHGMACAAEVLLNEIEEEYVPLYKMQKAYEGCDGDLIKFDKWINQYVNNREKLVESLNTFECSEENFAADPEAVEEEACGKCEADPEEVKCAADPEEEEKCAAEPECCEEKCEVKEEEACDKFEAEETVSKSEYDALMEKYTELNAKFEALTESVRSKEAQILAQFGADFINADKDVEEESRANFAAQISEKCTSYELNSEDEVKEFAVGLLARYYYDQRMAEKNKSENFSVNIQKVCKEEAPNKLRDAINKLNHI